MKHSIRKFMAAALSLLGISSLSFGAACAVKSTEVAEPVNTVITKTDAPTDGSLPTAHTGTENLAYIASVLEAQTQYHTYSYTLTNAAIATQITRGYRDFKDGVLISSDITYSSMVKSGTQTCTVFNEETGEYEVYLRSSAEPTSTTTATNAEWSTEAPVYFSKNAYNHTYGLLQTELTSLILNDETVLESSEVHVNPDGTYTQSFVLDPVASTYYYAFCMKTNGGLGGFPAFQSVTLSVTFTDKWLPLTTVMHDVSTVNKGVTVTSVSDTTCEFTYGETDAEHFGYYDSYFKAFFGDDTLEQGGEVDEEFVLDVTNVLSNGFAKIMDGGEQFELEISLGKNKYCGFAFVALDLANPLETLEIRLSLGKTLGEQNFFVEYKNGEASAYYGNDFALDVNIATLKPVIAEISGWAEQLAHSFGTITEGGAADSAESGDMLSDLMNSMTLIDNGGEAVLALQTDDLLGLGIGVDLQLFFGVEEKSVTFRGGVVNGLSVGGSAIDLGVVIRTTTADIITHEKTEANANLTDYVADVFSLISSDLIKINVNLDGSAESVNISALKGLSADVTAYVDIDGVTVGAEAEVSYNIGGNALSAVMDIWYGYDVQSEGYGKAILHLKQINGAPVSVMVGCEISELVEAIRTVMVYGGAEEGVSLDGVVDIINTAFSRNFSSLLTEVYADDLQIKLGISIDTVLDMLGVDAGVKFGSCTLTYARGEGVYGGNLSAALPALGLGLTISGATGEIEQPDTENCLDLTYLVEDITSLAKADLYEINLTFDGDKIEQVKGLKADVTAYADIKGLAAYAKVNVSYTYNDTPVSAELRAWYEYAEATNGKVVLSLDKLNGVATNVKVSAEINETVNAVKELLAYCNVQLQMPELGGSIKLDEVLTSVLTADLATLIPELATSADGIKLGVNVDETLKLFNVNAGISIGTVNLAYSHANCNLTATVPALGLGLTISGATGEIEQPDTENCLDLTYLVEDITSLAKADLYEINLTFDGDKIEQVKGLKADVTAYADIKGLAAYAKVNVSYTYNNTPVSAELRAWYEYAEATNGKVVLSLDKLNGVALNVKVSAEINETVNAVKELLAYCNVQLQMPELGGSIKLDEVLTSVLTADLATLIPELATSADGLKLGVNVDEALKLFNVNAGLSIGTVNLAYSHANCNLTASVPALGLGLTISGATGEIEQPDTENCLDLTYLVEDITSLAKADLYEINLTFDGDKIEQVKGLKADVTAYADIKGLAAYAKVNVSYTYNNTPVSAELRAWYEYAEATNGKVVLSLDKLNGIATNVKVSAEINETVNAVKELLAYCNVQLQMPELGGSIKLDEVLTSVLTADLATLIPELATSADGLKLGVNVDEALKLFNVNAGLSIGTVNLAYSHANCNLTASVPALGLGLTISGATGEIEQPDTSNCLDLTYLVEDITSLAKADLYEINLTFDGDKIEQVKGLKADVTAYADIKGLAAYAKVNVSYTYNNTPVSAELRAWYEYAEATNGKVVLSLDKLNGTAINVKVSAEINDTVNAVKELLAYCNVQLQMPELGGSIKLDEVLTSVLTADLATLIPELATSADGLKLGVNVDEALKLFNVDAGISIGTVNLAYSHANCNLTATVPALGLGLTISGATGEIEQPDTSNCLDLTYLVEDITSLAKADLYEINLTFDGDKIEQVKGLKADVTAYADIKGLAAYAKVNVSYTYNNTPVSAELRAWYEYAEATNGKVVLSLDKLNGIATNVKVSAEINDTVNAVKELLAYCNVQLQMPELGGSIKLDEVLTSVLTADLATLIPELATSADGIKLGVNVDEALKLFNVNAGINIGTVNLAYSHANCNLTATVPALGLGLTISGATGEIEQKPQGNVLDLAELVRLVNSAAEQVKGIIDGESVSFEIVKGQTYLSLDGLTVNLWGNGEVSWKKGSEYVALDLGMSIAESGLDVTALKLLYQKNVEGAPLVRLALNEVGIDIYNEDIQTVSEGFARIYDKITTALGGKTESSSTPENSGANNEETQSGINFSSLTSNDKLMGLLFKALSSGSWVDVLNDMTLTVDKEVVTENGVESVKRSLTLTYAADNATEIRVSTYGNISLFYDSDLGEFAFGGEVKACAANGSLVQTLNSKFDAMNMLSSKTDGSASFVRLAYDYLFEAISSISVKDILGTDTYAVTFGLIGDNCNIPQLSGVVVDAEIYITGASCDNGKIAEADLTLNVSGVAVDLNVISERSGNQTKFYINLRQVANIKLPDLKVLATQNSLYETLEVLVSAINDTNVISFVSGFLNQGATQSTEVAANSDGESGEKIVADDTVSRIASIVEKLMNFNFGEAIVAERVGDITTAVFDLDNVARQLEINCEPLGTVEVTINHKYHSMKTSAKASVKDAAGVAELKEWIWLSSEKTAARDYSKVDKSKYVNIEFIPSLLKDALKFATDDSGNVYEMFTFSGLVDVNLVKIIDIKLDISTLTLGIGKDTGFYFSLIANLKGGMVTENTIGLTYANGYLTLGRNLSSANPEYKIMTFEYFIDNLFAKGSGSTLNWLLGVSNTLWNTVVGLMGDLVNMNSGLTSPEDIYLYKTHEDKPEQEISMYDYVNALRVIVGGNKTADFGDITELEKTLGVHDNYYGFDLNSGLFTNNVITKLYAAITRTDETGINGIKAYGAIQSYVTFSASFNYREGLTKDNYFKIGESLSDGVSAPSLYAEAEAKAKEAGVTIDYNHFVKMPENGYDEKFGCFSTADMSHSYSHVLYSHELTIIALDGTKTCRNVRHGSVIYLYDNSSPVYANAQNTERLVYSLEENGDVIGDRITADGNLTLYEITRTAVNVIIENGTQEIVITSFSGDSVPTSVAGLDTIEGPFYADETKVAEGDVIGENVSVLRLHGVFVQSEVIVNYVKYTFDAASRSYVASGKAAGFVDKYCTNGETLVLENAIGGYQVTAIAAGAFANTDGKPIKNVVVPENITKVDEGAFLNNKDMQSIVFLADSVYFEGSEGNGTFAFFGCSTSSDEESTVLKIYYNEATCYRDGKWWTNFSKKSVVGTYYKYVGNDPDNKGSGITNYHADGGGELHANGSWCVLDVEVIGAESVQEEGLDFAAQVNAKVSSGFKPDAMYTQENADALKAELTQILSQYSNEVGGDKYVAEVTLKQASACRRILTVTVSVNIPRKITLHSKVALTYTVGSSKQDVEANKDVTVFAASDGDEIKLNKPENNSGYLFLGWAVENGETLSFVGEKVKYEKDAVYYAIWGASKVNQEVKAQVNYSGNQLSMPESGNGKWYDDSWNEVNTVTKNCTVVYTRTKYTFKYGVSGNIVTTIVDTAKNSTNKGSQNYSASIEVLEGQKIKGVKANENHSFIIYIDDVQYTELKLEVYKVLGISGKWYTFANDNLVDGEYNATVEGNCELSLKY